MADQTNYFSYDVYSGKININPLNPSEMNPMQFQYGLTGSVESNLLNIEAEKNVLNTAIISEQPTAEEVKFSPTTTLFVNPTSPVDTRIAAQTTTSAEKTETKQVDMMKAIEDLKKQIIDMQIRVGNSVGSEMDKMKSTVDALIASTQDQYSSDYIISASDQQLFFDLKLEDVSNPPEWS